jgi:cytidine deaminase
MPCGACRQVIWDLCGNIPIYISAEDGHLETHMAIDLLPLPFDDSKLKETSAR